MSGLTPSRRERSSSSIRSPSRSRERAGLRKHERGGCDRDRIVDRVLVGARPRERSIVRDFQAFALEEDFLVRLRRLHVIDAKIERREGAWFFKRAADRHAAALVEKAGDDAAMDDAGVRIADQLFGI